MVDRVSIEMWDHIASFIAKPTDLLHFALTSSRFCALIIPAHLNYCAVSADAYNEAFWTDLTLKKAGRLRELNISGFSLGTLILSDGIGAGGLHNPYNIGLYNEDRFPRTTRCVVPEGTAKELLCLDCTDKSPPKWVTLMSHFAIAMTGLRKVTLRLTICDVARLSRNNFFANLSSPQLGDFALHLSRCDPEHLAEQSLEEALSGLEELKGGYSTFALDCSLGAQANGRVMDVILSVLDRKCRDLQNLHVGTNTGGSVEALLGLDIAWPLFWHITWPQLQSLSFDNIWIRDEDRSTASAFLQRHPHIQSLRMMTGLDYSFDLDLHDALPHLRELAVSRLGANSLQLLLGQCKDSYRPIESLLFEAVTTDPEIGEAVDALCRHGARCGSLRRLEFVTEREFQPETRFWLRSIAQSNPQLIALDTDPSRVCANETEWLELLISFPNLEVLLSDEPDCWFDEDDEDGDGDEDEAVDRPNMADIIKAREARLPKLRQLNDWIKVSDDNEWRNQFPIR